MESLIDSLYNRNDVELKAGKFRVRGDIIDIFPAYANQPIRVEFWGDEVEAIREIDPVSGETLQTFQSYRIYPANQYVTSKKINWVVLVKPLKMSLKEE